MTAILIPGTQPVPIQIIRQYCGGKLYVEILDEIKPNGKRDFTNTTTHGSTMLIHQSQIINS